MPQTPSTGQDGKKPLISRDLMTKAVLIVLSVAAFSWLTNFWFTVIILSCVLVHEYGHIWAMKYYGMNVKGVYFIPFLGMAAVTTDQAPTRWADVHISLAGPFIGALLGIPVYAVYLYTGNPLYGAIAGMIGVLNLFNLLPVFPLDGGRVMKDLAHSMSPPLFWLLHIVCSAVSLLLLSQISTLFLFILAYISFKDMMNEYRTRSLAQYRHLLVRRFNLLEDGIPTDHEDAGKYTARGIFLLLSIARNDGEDSRILLMQTLSSSAQAVFIGNVITCESLLSALEKTIISEANAAILHSSANGESVNNRNDSPGFETIQDVITSLGYHDLPKMNLVQKVTTVGMYFVLAFAINHLLNITLGNDEIVEALIRFQTIGF